MIELILKTLVKNSDKGCTLEELTCIVGSTFVIDHNEVVKAATQRANQAVVLDALLQLDKEGLIILNPDNDKSYITRIGLQRIMIYLNLQRKVTDLIKYSQN